MVLHLAPSTVVPSFPSLPTQLHIQRIMFFQYKPYLDIWFWMEKIRSHTQHFCNATTLLQSDKREVSFLLFLLWWNVHTNLCWESTKDLHNPSLWHRSPFSWTPLLTSCVLHHTNTTPDNHPENPNLCPLEISSTKEPRGSLFDHFRLKKKYRKERKDLTKAI